MSKMNWKSLKTGISKRSPQILTAVAILELAATVYLSIKATPKAEKLIKDAEEKKGDKLTPVEVVKTAWKPYVPAVIVGMSAVSCMIGANTVHTRRNAALAAACQLAETTFNDYKEKVIETVGEKKEELIRDSVAQNLVNKTPESFEESNIINTGKGTTLFKDWASGRAFRHDRVEIERAVNRLNHRINTDYSVSLSEFYYEIDLDPTGISDSLGWSRDQTGLIDVKFSPAVAPNGEPCFLVHFARGPIYGPSW